MTGKARTNRIKRLQSLLLAILFTISLLPPVEVRAVSETHTFTSGAVVLDSSYDGDTVIIHNGVFSVTVVGATDINIRFVDVTIDRRHDPNTNDADPLHNTVVPGLYEAAQKLGWGTKAPVCPFLVTGNSSVTAGFTGNCTFYAGTNSSSVSANNTYTASRGGGGYAGIQVDAGSSLTITDAENLIVYGAHQLGLPDENGMVTNNRTTALYSDVLRANADMDAAGYDDPYDNQYNACQTHSQFTQSGGAGIGGGVAFDTTSSATATYTQGTPGNIIIEGGNIEAFGGYAAAGIGGSVNGAATKSTITINGGNVIAHGGRFAAGIGDGDSVPTGTGQGPSPDFRDATGRIEINGGTVTAYGGVASAGIGCTDDMSTNQGFNGSTSQLEIAINGGAVNAFSGFPDGYNGGTFPNEAPAAIGAGSKSNMESNSIYISSAADLLCAGFGNYSLTENGTRNTTVPVINVDSDGYLLLLKTGDYFSNDKRVLSLWKPQVEEIPDIGTCVKYTIQETGNIYYICDDEEGNRLIYEKRGDNYVRITGELTRMTLYVDENSQPLTDDNGNPVEVDLAYFFRSMALTLPEPEKHGGLYAITVPTEGVSTGDKPGEGAPIILTVEAYEQGTQSGTIAYPSNHNMSMEDTADRLTDLDVYPDSSIQLPADGLIGGVFKPGVFAYTVYVEPDVDEVTLRAEFEDNHATYTVTLDGKSLRQDDQGDTIQVSTSIDLSGGNTKTVRLRKQDGTNSMGAIVYKVTIIKKSEYTLDLSDPTKVYDGNPVDVIATGVGEYAEVGTLVDMPGTLPGNTAESATKSTTTYQSTVRVRNSRKAAAISMQLDVIPRSESIVDYILTLKLSQSGTGNNITIDRATSAMGWQVDYTSLDNPDITQIEAVPAGVDVTSRNWIGTATTTQLASSGSNTLKLVTVATGSVNLVANYTSTNTTIFSIGSTNVRNSVTVDDKEKQAAVAKTAIKTGATEGSFPYEIYTETGCEQTLTVRTITAGTNSNTVKDSPGNISVTVQSTKTYTAVGAWEIKKDIQFFPVSLPAEELEQVILTYYQTHEADGTPIAKTPLGSTPPTDAGTYLVEAELQAKTYNATGKRSFTISRREVWVRQITNWLLYVKAEPASDTLSIPDPGAILLDNVVSEDAEYVSIDHDSVKAYYNETSLTYRSDKITLEDAKLIGDRAFNYYLRYDDKVNALIFVFGQIALDMHGSTFRKTADGDWRKYYPQSDGDPVGAATNPPDYHSPAVDGIYRAHSEYVRARTVNQGSGVRYAVDIEYGDMQFNFFRAVWDVNQLAYVDNVNSAWIGMDGNNNRITLTNYSNAEIYYKVSAQIKPYYAAIDDVRGIRAKVSPDAGGTGEMTTWTSVAAATPGDSVNNGSSSSGECYLFLSGVPQMQESGTYIEVGTIMVSLAPTGGS